MSEENNGVQQTPTDGYQDPLMTENGKPAKKKMGGSTIAATIVSVVVFYFFGLLGGLICYGGYWLVYAIIRSKMPVAAKVILSVVVVLVFLVLLVLFILFAAALTGGA